MNGPSGDATRSAPFFVGSRTMVLRCRLATSTPGKMSTQVAIPCSKLVTYLIQNGRVIESANAVRREAA
jgi:hypothetical protein